MRRPRIKLITLPWELEVPTLSLASLAAVTPSRFEVSIVDVLREPLFVDEPVDLVGITASTPRIKAAYALADEYRRRGTKVVIGGHHATALPEEALEHADAVVTGEGDVAWARLCEDFLGNPTRVQGIVHGEEADLETLPVPRTDLLRLERYGRFSFPVIATRGCPEKCSFCFSKRMTKVFRTYPIANVLEQIRRRPSFVKAMYFVDDNLPGDLDYVRELFRALKREGVPPFGIQARHEFAREPADLRLAAEAGCALVSSGYESVNQTTLDRTGKKAQAEEYLEGIRAIYDTGMLPSGNWMFGFDWDTPDIFERTLEFLDRSLLLHCSFTTEIPFPGTPAFRKYRQEGRLLTEDYDQYVGKDHVVVRPKAMTPDELQRGIRWLARSYYSASRALHRVRVGIANPRMGTHFRPRLPSMLFLNFYQSWQWHLRMVPPLRRLTRRLESANPYRHVRDQLRRTNFRPVVPDPEPA